MHRCGPWCQVVSCARKVFRSALPPASGAGSSPSGFKRLTSPNPSPCAQPSGLSPVPLADPALGGWDAAESGLSGARVSEQPLRLGLILQERTAARVGEPLCRGAVVVAASVPGPNPSGFKRLTSPHPPPCAQPPGLSPVPLASPPRCSAPAAAMGGGGGPSTRMRWRLPGSGGEARPRLPLRR